ncbi:phosphatase PAP2 family protein [Geobacter sp. FeAm09]|uniref:phosphatase PAP2 family protein n=1 Tax=Geobacter sp. FeAm09 TaxID=2597769 RepID=UPI0011EBDCFA|nr:phosphatase PAP2 family protein [Geobacter sp. FeAm09]QEM67343.1 phosphatase PAP2 family protein [Geobacter sp. FeAm09]
MQANTWREALLAVVFLTVVTAIIAATGADLAVSSHFHRSGGWPVGEQFPWKALYHMDRFPALVLASFGLCAACYGSYKPSWHPWRRRGAFLVLLLALGPGVLVNAVFKDHWGRPRPCEIVQFGGSRQFLHPWQPGIDGQGRSFPSGHSAAAFYLTAPFFVYRRTRPALAAGWLAGGLGFGLLMSYARIAQGGHFLSDTLWSWGMIYLTALALSALLLPRRVDMVYLTNHGELQET